MTAFIVIAALTWAAAAAGGWWTGQSVSQWYPALAKPSWTPPSWVFGPVWTFLYTAMAVAAWLVWRKLPAPEARLGLQLYAAQLVLNAAWSGLFFGLRSPSAGMVCIAALAVALAAATAVFFRASAAAGALMSVYLAWVCFAAALNLAIWRLNA